MMVNPFMPERLKKADYFGNSFQTRAALGKYLKENY